MVVAIIYIVTMLSLLQLLLGGHSTVHVRIGSRCSVLSALQIPVRRVRARKRQSYRLDHRHIRITSFVVLRLGFWFPLRAKPTSLIAHRIRRAKDERYTTFRIDDDINMVSYCCYYHLLYHRLFHADVL